MKHEINYRINGITHGPVELNIIEDMIARAHLPDNTPLQLTSDMLWSDIYGIKRKISQSEADASLPTRSFMVLISVNLIIACIAIFVPMVSLLAGVVFYASGLTVNYFEEGRRNPGFALFRFIILLFPILLIVRPLRHSALHDFPLKSASLFLISSGLFQFLVLLGINEMR